MQKGVWFWLTIILVAAGLVASAILLVDYVRPGPVFCVASGCSKVRESVFARPFGVPLPAAGLIGMLAIAFAALVPGREARVMQAVLAVLGAGAGLLFFGIQAKLRTVCPFCAVVDGAAILLAALSLVRWKKEWDPPPGRLVTSLTIVGLIAAIAVPLGIGFSRRALPDGVPSVIADEMQRTGPGRVTVVEFVDFECLFCRMTHAELAPLLEARKDEIRLVRRQVPLSMHPHAMVAAQASHCGEQLGKGTEIAHALFTAPPEELTSDGCVAIARAHGLDGDRFRACMNDPATARQIEQDRQIFRAANGHGLPTLWIDGTKLEGAQDRQTLEETLDAAIRAL